MHRTDAVVLLLATALVVTGCATAAPVALAPAPTPVPVSTPVPISTSSWQPGDGGRTALIRGTLAFTPDGCPRLGDMAGVVWPEGFTSVVRPNGDQVLVTADGREISEGDTVVAGGAAAATEAAPGRPCIEPGTTLTLIQSSVDVIPGR